MGNSSRGLKRTTPFGGCPRSSRRGRRSASVVDGVVRVVGANEEQVVGWRGNPRPRSEEHTSELQSRRDLVCRLLLEKKKDWIIADYRRSSNDIVPECSIFT